jgi:hypothetical protein
MSRRVVLQVGGVVHGQRWCVKKKQFGVWGVLSYPGGAGLRIGVVRL